MKKLLLSAMAALSISAVSNAQVKVGDLAPDFTVTDINSVSHNLYTYLDSGYTVIIDISAAWCGPCWAVHSSHVFNNLTAQYGPNGTIQPKKIKVLWVDGESQNTTAQLYGTQGGTSATFTQGDWVTGTNFPIIDNNSLNSNYLYGGFPSFTVITRDRLVASAGSGYIPAMLSEPYWVNLMNNNAPATPPSATVDAKAVKYNSDDVFLCSATPTVKFQNYSVSQNITNATVKFYSGTTVLATQTWTGNLAPFQVASVTMPSFTPTSGQTGPYSFDVTVTGDSYAANNTQTVTALNIISSVNASPLPYSTNLDNMSDFPSKFILNDPNNLFAHSSQVSSGGNPVTVIGSNGQATEVGAIFYPNVPSGTTAEIMLGNYNTASATNPAFEFDIAHKSAASGLGSSDKLEVLVSTDCGTTWQTAYSKTGSVLSTVAPSSGGFIPNAANQWRKDIVNLSAYKNANLFVKLKATSSGGSGGTTGNYGWFDNFSFVANSTSIEDVITANSIQLYPNPATNNATIEFNVIKATKVTVQVVDVTGRVVANVANENMSAGNHKINISTNNLTTGIYNVRIQTESGNLTERLSVVK